MSDTKLFANDMKVYRVLRNTKKDVEELQKIFLPWNLGAMTGYRNLSLINAK